MFTTVRRALVATSLSLAVPLVAATAPALAATPDRGPFYVDEVEVRYLESHPVQVQLAISGSLPSPCHEPAWSVSDDGSFVAVELWGEADPEAFCSAVLEPTEVIVDVGAYEDGQRALIVNGRTAGIIEVGQPDEATRLVSAGWSFGMCLGYCRAELVSIDDRLRLTVSDNHSDTPLLVNHGTLSASGVARLTEALSGIDPATLDATYGCPDCADGGAAWVGLWAAGQGSRHEMPFGDPPVELADLYELTQSFISTLETCATNDLVVVDDDCVPREEG